MTRAKTNELKQALLAYFSALEMEPTKLPPLENPLDALVEALQQGASHPQGFALLDLSDTPYPGLASGDPSAPWRMQWAIQVAELEAFTCPAMEETLFLVDTLADQSGAHRVYTAEDGLRGDLEFSDIPAALNWMAARVKASAGAKKATLTAATKKFASVLEDDWEEDPCSGWNVFEALLDSGFAEAWDALSRGEWPILDGKLALPPSGSHPALARATMTWVTERFIRTQRVELPEDFDVDSLAAVHHTLLEQLRELAVAVGSGRAPSAISAALKSDDDMVRELAASWRARFEAAHRSLRSTPSPSVDVMPIRRAGKGRVAPAVDVAAKGPPDGLDELRERSEFDDLGDLGDLADLDLESDEEFAALERELGQSNVSASPGRPEAAKSPKAVKAIATKSAGKGGKAGKASKSDEDDLGGLGGALRALLGGGGGADADDEAEDVEMTPFNQKLMAALDVLLDRMEADEVIEIIRDRKQMLVREMVRAASDARSPKHMLSSLTRALVDSEQVEEIYATDDQIQRLLRGALGG